MKTTWTSGTRTCVGLLAVVFGSTVASCSTPRPYTGGDDASSGSDAGLGEV